MNRKDERRIARDLVNYKAGKPIVPLLNKTTRTMIRLFHDGPIGLAMLCELCDRFGETPEFKEQVGVYYTFLTTLKRDCLGKLIEAIEKEKA